MITFINMLSRIFRRNSGVYNLFISRNVVSKQIDVRFSSTLPLNEEQACSKTEKMAKKLRGKTPIGKLDELDEGKHPYQEKEPLKPFPDNTNPATGEVGGPKGPEPTRYGDWERKGRVSDF